MKLENILTGLFSKIDALSDIMQKGILDFAAHIHTNNQNKFAENKSYDNLEAELS